MQVTPNWTVSGTAKELEDTIGNGFEFKGPGLYEDTNGFALVVPLGEAAFIGQWKETWPPDERFAFHKYDAPFYKTVFGSVATAPVRSDKMSTHQKPPPWTHPEGEQAYLEEVMSRKAQIQDMFKQMRDTLHELEMYKKEYTYMTDLLFSIFGDDKPLHEFTRVGERLVDAVPRLVQKYQGMLPGGCN